MTITGKIPSIIANRLPQVGDNIIVTGSDIDIQVKDKGKISSLYAVRVGSDWEISELDDSANVFPEYDEADVISADVITKFFTSAVTSGLILSFNPLGKIKYGIKDKVDKMKDKVGKGMDWLTDKMTLEQAKVGKIDLMNKKDGGNYKVLVGNPADKTYSVWQLYRNGNEYRIPKKTTGLTADEAVQKYDSLEGNHYDGTKGKTEEEPLEDQTEVKGETQEESNVQEGTTEETTDTQETAEDTEQATETQEEDNVLYDEDGLKQAEMTEPTEEDKAKLNKTKQNGDWQTTETGEEYVVTDEEDNVSEGSAEEQVTEEDNVKEGSTEEHSPEDYKLTDYDPSEWTEEDEESYQRMEQKWKEKLAKENEERRKQDEGVHDFVKDYYNDKDEELTNALKPKKRKKSKYNGCNVTGCEDGNLAGFGTTM